MVYFHCNLCGESFPQDYKDGYCGKCQHVAQEHKNLLNRINEQETTIRKMRDEGFGLLTKYASELNDNTTEDITVKKSDLLNVWHALQLRWYEITSPTDFLVDTLKKGRLIISACALFRSNRPESYNGKSAMRRLYDDCVSYLEKYGKEENEKFPLDKIPD